MPKLKASRVVTKHLKKTGTGKLIRNKVYKSRVSAKRSTKRKRNLREGIVTDATNSKVMKKILPYL